MSAPDVNLDRQKRRHRPMLRGLWIGLAVAVGVALLWAVAAALGVQVTDAVTPASPGSV